MKARGLSNKELAIVVVCLVVIGAGVFYAWSVFGQAKVYSGPRFGSNLTYARINMEQYLDRNDGRFPDASEWMTVTKSRPTNRQPKHMPVLGVAFFKPLSGVKRADIKNPEKVPVLFLSNLIEMNASSGLETLAFVGKDDNRRAWVVFADGHFEKMPYSWRFETIVLEVEQE